MNRELLKKHFEQTPRMAPTDAVKLAFQSAFGCGHLLCDASACTDFVRREMAQIPKDASMPAFTPIGGCMCRLNLASPAVRALSPERITEMMLLTSERIQARYDNAERFENALLQINSAAKSGEAPFSVSELESYLAPYRAQGCPPVSHSETYRQAYHPAYRVVLTDLALLAPIMVELDSGRRNVVVIDGLCGSGKTTLAALLGRMYGVSPIPMDDFFLSFDLRTAERLSTPGGNVHYERFQQEVLFQLQPGHPIAYRRFDCATGSFIPKEFPASGIIIVEGSYSHHPAFEADWQRLNALRVFVETDAQEQMRRIHRRNPDMAETFRTRWVPLEKNYFEAYDIRNRADQVLTSQPWNRSLTKEASQ